MSLSVPNQAYARQVAGRTQQVNISAPVMGWNTRDAPDDMDPKTAVELTNWLPAIGRLEARRGYSDFVASGIGSDDVETLITLVSGSTEYFVACTNSAIYEIQTGTPTARTGGLTITSDRWQWTVFADSAASNSPKVLAVNGTDAPWQYGGGANATAWAPTGPTAASLAWVNTFKNRVFAGEANSRDFYYGGLGAIPGAMTKFPLSGIRGAQGNILFMASMTRDTGTGPDDYAVFVTDEGQAIVYAGTDPSSASTWSIVGVYQIPRPINSRRAYAQIFGDIVIATVQDYVFLSEALQAGGSVIIRPTQLVGAMGDVVPKYKDNYGWEIVSAPEKNLMLSNIPLETNSRYQQHATNLQTRAPTLFTGWNFRTYGVFGGDLYAGESGRVVKLLDGFSDDSSNTETPIQLRASSAWLDLGSHGIKHVRAVRPLLRSQTYCPLNLRMGVDFRSPQTTATVETGTVGASTLWGDTPGVTTEWGDTAGVTTHWSGAIATPLSPWLKWQTLGGRGAHVQLKSAVDIVDHRLEWLSTDFKVDLTGRF